jgi:protein AFG1
MEPASRSRIHSFCTVLSSPRIASSQIPRNIASVHDINHFNLPRLTFTLALHLQKLYERLIDYEPSLEYSDRLKQLSRTIAENGNDSSSPSNRVTIGTRGLWRSLLAQKDKRDTLALTRVLTSHEAAMNLQSPKGLMLHGEVGTGKSMLVDLFADSLPSRKKRRWHFNTFMLETISRLEQLRESRIGVPGTGAQDEYSLLWLARDLIEKSPILFLDEFQFPDRVASKILSNLMTSFFQLGGVLIATSNRMPEELARAAGMEFDRPVPRLSRLGWGLGMGGGVGRDDGPGQLGEYGEFMQVLRARCEVWEMEGKKDYRRQSGEEDGVRTAPMKGTSVSHTVPFGTSISMLGSSDTHSPASAATDIALPKHYLINLPPTASPEDLSSYEATLTETLHTITSTPPSQPIPWTSTTLTVYGRPLSIPAQHAGTALFSFDEICGAVLGPADYITLASTYHTFIVTSVPILGFLQKNEARRFITLLDALYEARCRLLVTADASPDEIFFPAAPTTNDLPAEERLTADSVYQETYSEIHQDLTSPFRPNVSSYGASSSLPIDALEDDPPNRVRRPGSSYTDERRKSKALDFANIRGLTGEDEVFAVKRAESRLWEMCSGKWWDRATVAEGVDVGATDWWRPLPLESRHWERSHLLESSGADVERFAARVVSDTVPLGEQEPESDKLGDMFPHGASPFRTVDNAPPRIWATHIWGMEKWGKRAGAWGKGVEGLEERRKEKDEPEKEVPADGSREVRRKR